MTPRLFRTAVDVLSPAIDMEVKIMLLVQRPVLDGYGNTRFWQLAVLP